MLASIRRFRGIARQGLGATGRFTARAASTLIPDLRQHLGLPESDTNTVIDGSDDQEVEKYTLDWLQKYSGPAAAVVRPKDTEQVSAVLQFCSTRGIGVVPQGGNTGMVGGSVPSSAGSRGPSQPQEEIVLSLERMNKCISFDKSSSIATAEAGCILSNMDDWLGEQGHMVPLDLGAKQSCHIGGNVATNAGGIRFLRYGSLHGSVVGLEAVLASGEVLDLLTNMRKDNVGTDLKQLFIGSEGTLGVITKVAIVAPPKPKSRIVALLACRSFENVLELLALARSSCGEALSAAEYFDGTCMDLLFSQPIGKSMKDPLEERYPHYFIAEVSGSNEEHDAAKMEDFVGLALAGEHADTGVLGDNPHMADELFALRESIASAVTHYGLAFKYDVSVPTAQMRQLVEEATEKVAPWAEAGVETVGYGHVGDSNLHLNITVPWSEARSDTSEVKEAVRNALEPWVLERVIEMGGSISAEHGVGVAKRGYMDQARSPAVLSTMRAVKRALDPKGILNPGKMLPDA